MYTKTQQTSITRRKTKTNLLGSGDELIVGKTIGQELGQLEEIANPKMELKNIIKACRHHFDLEFFLIVAVVVSALAIILL